MTTFLSALFKATATTAGNVADVRCQRVCFGADPVARIRNVREGYDLLASLKWTSSSSKKGYNLSELLSVSDDK